MDKDLLYKIFVPLRGIKQEVYVKSFQVNDISENLPPHVENARSKPLTGRERLLTWPATKFEKSFKCYQRFENEDE